MMNRKAARRARRARRMILTVALMALVAVVSIGATIAFLTDETAPITNTFTVGNIDIELDETGAENNAQSFKMVPGKVYTKDPTVTLKANSEPCYLFVKVEKTNNPDAYLNYSINTDVWTQLPDVDGVYYKEIATMPTADAEYAILTGNTVEVKNTVDKAAMDAIGANVPTLKFTAYACQLMNDTTKIDVATAWTEVNK